jgi:hypothetical protein
MTNSEHAAVLADESFIRELIERGSGASEGYFQYAHLVACLLDRRLHEQLRQLINGPIYDGSVISKSQRDELLRLRLATRVCCKGEQGYTAARYFALSVMKVVDQIKAGEVAA